MHELGIMFSVARTVIDFAEKNNVEKIDTLVLQVGQLSPMIPRFIEACYPAATDGTILQDTKLKIEILPANAICKSCDKVFNAVENKGKCPACGGEEIEILSGKELLIKEIIAC